MGSRERRSSRAISRLDSLSSLFGGNFLMKRFFRPRFFLLLSFFQIVMATTAFSQVDRAVLEGTITDSAGAVIAAADVRIHAEATGLEEDRRSNSNGYYRFPAQPIGRYTVTVSS